MTLDRIIQQDNAFADALIEIFKRHPIEEWKHESRHAVRGSALRKARAGGYRGDFLSVMRGATIAAQHSHWRKQLREELAEDWGAPPDEVVAVHLLIYG